MERSKNTARRRQKLKRMAKSKLSAKKLAQLKPLFDSALASFHHESHLDRDPLGLVHRYRSPEDQELAAFMAATFAFGNVTSMKRFLVRLLLLFGDHPRTQLGVLKSSDFSSLSYRFIHSADIAAFIESLRTIIVDYGSLESAFLSSPSADHYERLLHLRNLLLSASPRRSRAIHFLFSNPEKSSAKRWHLFLRWVVRRPPIDLGLWTRVSPANLVIPVDTHIFDMALGLGLVHAKGPSRQVAEDITQIFKTWSPKDPTLYDFSLCQMGIRGLKKDTIKLYRSSLARTQPASSKTRATFLKQSIPLISQANFVESV